MESKNVGLTIFLVSRFMESMFHVTMMAIIVLYTFVVGPWRIGLAGEPTASCLRQLSFLLAILLMYLTQGGPLKSAWTPYVHVSYDQHGYFLLLVPPLLLYGIPIWLWRADFSEEVLATVVFPHPDESYHLSVSVHSVILLYHMPDNHDWIMTHLTVHRLFYLALSFRRL